MNDTTKVSNDGGDFEAVRADIDALRKDLSRLMEHVKSGAFRNLGSRVDERPLTSLLVAFGLGLIGGKLMLR